MAALRRFFSRLVSLLWPGRREDDLSRELAAHVALLEDEFQRQGMTAETAGYAVGYASPSQFNREFKRLFGLPPAAEIKRMRESFAIPPAKAASDYVSSH